MCATMWTFALPACPGAGCRVGVCARDATDTRSAAMHAHELAAVYQCRFDISFSAPGASDLSCFTRSARVDLDRGHHSRLDVLPDVAVQHPRARIRQIEEKIHGRPNRDDGGVFPDEIRIGLSIALDDQKALAVQMNRMIHRVLRGWIVVDAEFDDVALLVV